MGVNRSDTGTCRPLRRPAFAQKKGCGLPIVSMGGRSLWWDRCSLEVQFQSQLSDTRIVGETVV